MMKMRNERKSNHPLYQRLGPATKQFIEKNEPDIIEWLDDALKLCEATKGDPIAYHDYTFVVTPAFKALEKWIVLIAPSIGIPEKEVERITIAKKSMSLVSDENKLDEFFSLVLKSLSATDDLKNDLRFEISSLTSFLKTYRHDVAHCWNIIGLPVKAEEHINQILSGISRITTKLIEVGLMDDRLQT